MATSVDITVKKNDTWDGVQYDVKVNDEPLPVGTSVKMDIRKDGKTGTLMKTISSAAGEITVTNTTTETQVVVNPFDVEFAAGTYYYDVQFTMSTRKKTYIEGLFIVEQDVTQG